MWKKGLIFALVLLMIMLVTVTSMAQPNMMEPVLTPATMAYPTDQIMIRFADVTDATALLSVNQDGYLTTLSGVAGVHLTYVREMSDNWHVLKLPERLAVDEVKQISAELATLENVVYAEPDHIRWALGRAPGEAPEQAPLLVPNDPRFAEQWHYGYTPGTAEGLNLPQAWNITTGSASVVVAVIDTGILNHADLAGRTVPGYDFIDDLFVANDGNGRDNNPADPGDWITANECGFQHSAQPSSWHGTHVAGTIGAATNNGVGVAGVNWNAKILPVRVLGKCGGYTSDIVDGVRWAAGLSVAGVPANANPAKVLNLSLGGQGSCSSAEQSAYAAVTAAGATVVVAAGNDNANAANYSPASCNNVITVASTNRTGSRAYYSNYGSVVEVSAPGGDTASGATNGVLSTLDGGTTTPANDNAYAYYQGTSMAAPHVAGLASLIVGENPTYTPAQVLSVLQSSARPFPAGSSCNTSICGSGIVDAYQALITEPPSYNYSIFLPFIIYQQYTPPPPSNPFVNWNFELGRNVGWAEGSSHGYEIVGTSFPGSVTPRSGGWAAWLGGDNNEISLIQQQVTVPAGAPYLTYYHWIASADACGYDFGGVLVNGAVVDVYTLCTSTSTGGWVKHVVNLGSYANQSVMVQIRSENDSSLNSNLFVDDVSFESSAAMNEVGMAKPDAASAAPKN